MREQKNQLAANKKKELYTMKLLHAIRKKGIDIEEIYNDEVISKEENAEGENFLHHDKY